jgi:hypothetical protein
MAKSLILRCKRKGGEMVFARLTARREAITPGDMMQPSALSRRMSPPARPVESLIHVIRGQKVMLDSDLAALYDVPTKVFSGTPHGFHRARRCHAFLCAADARFHWELDASAGETGLLIPSRERKTGCCGVGGYRVAI